MRRALRFLTWVGYALVASEVVWTVWWCTIAVRGVREGGQNDARTVAGLTAMVSPHTALLVYCATSARDLNRHCSDTNACSLEQPAYIWYLGSALAIPFDAIQIVVNSNLGIPELTDVSILTLVNSCAVFVWGASVISVVLYYTKIAPRRKAKGSDGAHVQL